MNNLSFRQITITLTLIGSFLVFKELSCCRLGDKVRNHTDLFFILQVFAALFYDHRFTGSHKKRIPRTLIWLRGKDLNLRPSGYEPDELPDCSTPRSVFFSSTTDETAQFIDNIFLCQVFLELLRHKNRFLSHFYQEISFVISRLLRKFHANSLYL